MAILNLLYLRFTFDSKEFKGALSTIYNPKILAPYMHRYVLEIGTCKTLKILIFSTISNLVPIVNLFGSTIRSVQEHRLDFLP